MNKILLCLSLSILLAQDPTFRKIQSKKRIALVVGVAQYRKLTPLNTPVNDAQDISAALSGMNFQVVTLLDPNLEQMKLALDKVVAELDESSSFVFYYSGHGLSVGEDNYLLLSGAHLYTGRDLPKHAYSVSSILEKIHGRASPAATILILDVCSSSMADVKKKRLNNEYQEGIKANYPPVNNTFIAYASKPGLPAPATSESHSVYTSALLKYISLPNIPLTEMFGRVAQEVRNRTSGAQIPFIVSTMDKSYYLKEENPEIPASRNSHTQVVTLSTLAAEPVRLKHLSSTLS